MQSHPINPEAPSLLTTIPGEVRNAIFEALFELGHPITISRDRYAYGDSSCYQSRDVRGIALLRTCRKIHEEVIGILYSRNIFCVKDDPRTADPIHWAIGWLDDIGRQSSYVRHLQIYMYNTFYDPMHDPMHDPIDILPILRHVWMPNLTALEVELLLGLPLVLKHPSDDIAKTGETNAASCNRQLRAIIDDSSECIKRFRAVPPVLRHVWLNFDGKVAHVSYCRTRYDPGCPLSGNIIHIVDDEAQSILTTPTRVVDVRSIMRPSAIRDSILTMALSPAEGIIFDLTNRTANVDVPYIALTIAWLTALEHGGFLEMDSSVALTSPVTRAGFTAELKFLGEWQLGSPARIFIRYFLEDNVSLDDVRFDASALLHATRGINVTTLVIVEIYSKSGPAPANSYTMSLTNIRQSTLLFMYQIFKKSPEHGLAHRPKIWMSGRGEAREAEWDSSKPPIEPIVNKDVGVSSSVTEQRWYVCSDYICSNLFHQEAPLDSLLGFMASMPP